MNLISPVPIIILTAHVSLSNDLFRIFQENKSQNGECHGKDHAEQDISIMHNFENIAIFSSKLLAIAS